MNKNYIRYSLQYRIQSMVIEKFIITSFYTVDNTL